MLHATCRTHTCVATGKWKSRTKITQNAKTKNTGFRVKTIVPVARLLCCLKHYRVVAVVAVHVFLYLSFFSLLQQLLTLHLFALYCLPLHVRHTHTHTHTYTPRRLPENPLASTNKAELSAFMCKRQCVQHMQHPQHKREQQQQQQQQLNKKIHFYTLLCIFYKI